MATTDKLVSEVKSNLESLRSGLDGRTSEITKAFTEAKKQAESNYKEAVKLADKTLKDSLTIAEKSKEEALLAFKSEQSEIKKLEDVLRILTGEVQKQAKPLKEPKTKSPAKFTVPRSFSEANTDNQKVYFAISEIGSGVIPDILTKVNSYGEGFDTKRVSNAVTALKNKFQVIDQDGKVGKASKYKVIDLNDKSNQPSKVERLKDAFAKIEENKK
jgi:vacuolar-type H+-ATPase subunit H